MLNARSALRPLILVAVAAAALPAVVVAAEGEGETLALSLDDALRIALANNLDLVSARIDPELSAQDVVVQQATFDPVASFGYNHSESERKTTTDLVTSSSSTSDGFSATLDQQLDFGATYRATLFSQQDTAAGPFVTSPRSWTSGVALNFQMPLLKGFGTEATTEQLVLARSGLDISRNDLEVAAERIVEQVEGAYWDVLAAGEALRIARLSLTRAEDLLALNRKKVEVGTLAPIEITQAEAGVASQEEGVIVAETNLRNAEDELRRLLAFASDDPRWETPIACTDRPDFQPRPIDLERAIETAFAERPELATARERVASSELSERVAKRGVRNQLDFEANFRPIGLDAEFTDPGPDNIPGTPDDVTVATASLGESLSNVTDLDNYSWDVGLTYRMPIRNRADKARYGRARLGREKSEVALTNQEQSIRVEVRSAVRAVESGIKRVEAARVNVGLQEKKLEAEQKKFENGMSTSFEVLTFQNDLADAELSRIRAALDYIKALAALERAQGTLLEARGLALD